MALDELAQASEKVAKANLDAAATADKPTRQKLKDALAAEQAKVKAAQKKATQSERKVDAEVRRFPGRADAPVGFHRDERCGGRSR